MAKRNRDLLADIERPLRPRRRSLQPGSAHGTGTACRLLAAVTRTSRPAKFSLRAACAIRKANPCRNYYKNMPGRRKYPR